MIPSVADVAASHASHAPHRNDRLIALFLLGVVAFTPPLLRVFGGSATVFGWPLLSIYVFLFWAVVVALIAIDVEFRGEERKRRPEGKGSFSP